MPEFFDSKLWTWLLSSGVTFIGSFLAMREKLIRMEEKYNERLEAIGHRVNAAEKASARAHERIDTIMQKAR